MIVIDVVARAAKLLIKDGLTFLADDEEAGFKGENIKKCVLHYLHEIFNMDEYRHSSPQNIWDFITEHVSYLLCTPQPANPLHPFIGQKEILDNRRKRHTLENSLKQSPAEHLWQTKHKVDQELQRD